MYFRKRPTEVTDKVKGVIDLKLITQIDFDETDTFTINLCEGRKIFEIR